MGLSENFTRANATLRSLLVLIFAMANSTGNSPTGKFSLKAIASLKVMGSVAIIWPDDTFRFPTVILSKVISVPNCNTFVSAKKLPSNICGNASEVSWMVIFGMVSVRSNSFIVPRMSLVLLGTLLFELHENSTTAIIHIVIVLLCIERIIIFV
ncbi:hypothetical protein D3C80_1324470 [compost metagenome]